MRVEDDPKRGRRNNWPKRCGLERPNLGFNARRVLRPPRASSSKFSLLGAGKQRFPAPFFFALAMNFISSIRGQKVGEAPRQLRLTQRRGGAERGAKSSGKMVCRSPVAHSESTSKRVHFKCSKSIGMTAESNTVYLEFSWTYDCP